MLVLDRPAHEVAAREEGDGRSQERIEDGKRLCARGRRRTTASPCGSAGMRARGAAVCLASNHAKNCDAVDVLEIRTEVQACLHQLVDRVSPSKVQCQCAAKARMALKCRTWRWSLHSPCKGAMRLRRSLRLPSRAPRRWRKELQAAPMEAEVEAEALLALHGTTSVLERQVEAVGVKFMLLHLESAETVHCGIVRGKRFQCLLQLCGQASDSCEPGFRVDGKQS